MRTIREEGLLGIAPEGTEALLVMLHGYGDSAEGFFGLVPAFAASVPGLAVFAIDAPYENEQPEIAAFGGRQWFSLKDYFARGFAPGDFSTPIERTFPYVKSKIARAAELAAAAPEKIFVMGFSQGAMVALSYALTSTEETLGAISVSGIGDFKAGAIVAKPPVFSIHGTADDVVPFAAQEELRRVLEKAGVPARFIKVQGATHNDVLGESSVEQIAGFVGGILRGVSSR